MNGGWRLEVSGELELLIDDEEMTQKKDGKWNVIRRSR
jgi:hypothetical protein